MQLSKFVHIADQRSQRQVNTATWKRSELAGRLVQLSGKGNRAALSFAASLLHQTQEEGEHCAWIGPAQSVVYPPDLSERGIDVEAIPFIVAPDIWARLRSAERLLRSGAFALVVLDAPKLRELPLRIQGRLASLAKHHSSIVLILTDASPGGASLGTMIPLHLEATREAAAPGAFHCTLHARKDKRRGPHWRYSEYVEAPLGMY